MLTVFSFLFFFDMSAQTQRYGFNKHMYHAFRLLFELENIVQGRLPRIYFTDEEQVSFPGMHPHGARSFGMRSFLLSIRTDSIGRDQCLMWLNQRLELAIQTLKRSSLPSCVDFNFVNEWLISVRTKISLG